MVMAFARRSTGVFLCLHLCYEYDRKDAYQACPQCKTKNKRHKGSPSIRWEEVVDGDVVCDLSDFNYSNRGQEQKQKIAEGMLSWQMSYGRGDDAGMPNFPGSCMGHPLTCLLMGGNRKRVHPLPYADVNHSHLIHQWSSWVVLVMLLVMRELMGGN